MNSVSYIDRINELQAQMDANPAIIKRKYAGLTAEQVVRGQVLHELDGVNDISGVAIAKRNANIMRADMAVFKDDKSKYTQSLGAATGPAAEHYVAAAKQAKGNLNGVYIYGSGWQWAAMSSDMSPLPDTSSHPKDTIPKQISEIYRHLQLADQRELTDIFNKIDAAKRANASEAELQKLYSEIDNYESHIRPMIGDIDAGFGNADDAYKLAVEMIKAGVCCIQIENQKSDAKQCGHQDGKVTVPREEYLAKLKAVRKAFLDMGVENGVIVARTDSVGASLTADIPDIRSPHAKDYIKHLKMEEITKDKPLQEGELVLFWDNKFVRPARLPNGLYQFRENTGHARAIEDAVFAISEAGADSIWIETSKASLKEITSLKEGIAAGLQAKGLDPNDLHLTYNNSPSFPWTANTREMILREWATQGVDISAYPKLDDKKLAVKLASAEYDSTPLAEAARKYIQEFQAKSATTANVGHHLITLAEFHALGLSTQILARGYFTEKGMLAYVEQVQDPEFKEKVATVAHQHHVGSDVTDYGKKVLEGEAANVAGGKHNTQNLITALLNEQGNQEEKAETSLERIQSPSKVANSDQPAIELRKRARV